MKPAIASCLLVGLFLVATPAAPQPSHLDEWSIASTDHFDLYSDADPARAAEIASSLELFRAVFSLLAPELDLDFPAPTYFFAFKDAEAYAPYKAVADAGGVKILGQFLSHRDVNYVTLNADPSHLGSFSVVFHEYVHYFVKSNFPGVPRWFNEGLAEYYSTFAVEGSRAVVGRPVERHLRWLARNAELRLEEVLGQADSSAGFNEAQKAGRFYAVSWILVHYLLSGGEERGDQLASFLSDTEAAGEPRDAFESAFDLRLADLEDELRSYLLTPSLPAAAVALESLPAAEVAVRQAPPADVLSDLGELLARMGREVEAERHLRLALDYVPDHADAHAGLGYVRHREGRAPEAEQLFRRAVELESRRALTYLLYGRHLLTAAQSGGLAGEAGTPRALARRARDAFRVAVGLDGDFAEARAMLGYSHLFGDLDPSEGIAHMERATAELTGRSDLFFQLLQLYLRAGRSAQADALVDHELPRFGDDELLARAREEVRRWRLVQAANEALAGGEYEQGLRLLDEAISVTTDPALRARLMERLDTLERQLSGSS